MLQHVDCFPINDVIPLVRIIYPMARDCLETFLHGREHTKVLYRISETFPRIVQKKKIKFI